MNSLKEPEFKSFFFKEGENQISLKDLPRIIIILLVLIEIWLLIIKYYYAAAILVSILIVVLTVSVIMKWNLLYKPYIPVLLKITPSSITVGKKKFPMRDVRLEEIRQKLEC